MNDTNITLNVSSKFTQILQNRNETKQKIKTQELSHQPKTIRALEALFMSFLALSTDIKTVPRWNSSFSLTSGDVTGETPWVRRAGDVKRAKARAVGVSLTDEGKMRFFKFIL